VHTFPPCGFNPRDACSVDLSQAKFTEARMRGEVDAIGSDFVKLERYVTLNIKAIDTVLKEHDR
jgi:hypothetical protein